MNETGNCNESGRIILAAGAHVVAGTRRPITAIPDPVGLGGHRDCSNAEPHTVNPRGDARRRPVESMGDVDGEATRVARIRHWRYRRSSTRWATHRQ